MMGWRTFVLLAFRTFVSCIVYLHSLKHSIDKISKSALLPQSYIFIFLAVAFMTLPFTFQDSIAVFLLLLLDSLIDKINKSGSIPEILLLFTCSGILMLALYFSEVRAFLWEVPYFAYIILFKSASNQPITSALRTCSAGCPAGS
jgi:hypothetical protein